MKCPYLTTLTKNPDFLCEAALAPYRPSVFELEEYCTTKRHQLCAFYCKKRAAEDNRTSRNPHTLKIGTP